MSEIKIENEHVFADVDTSGVAPQLVGYLEAVAEMPEVKALHDRATELLQPAPGERVLEVGCGLGADARELARAVAPGGSVTAVDVSEAMLNAARDRHDASLAVTYERADVCALPYDDATFDVIRIERVLQHVPDVTGACREMARVLKPGGRLLALDTDWGSLVADVGDDDLADRVLAHGRGRMIQPRAALHLRRLLAGAGLHRVHVEGHAFTYTSLETAAVLLPMFQELIPQEADFMPAADREAWFAAARRADEEGTFLTGWNAYLALAHKP
ncbi:MAG TPA: methyltransferase domain-containing protein [Mycobacteriales bacterium]|jgi:SAM-dependent methyltransferase